MSDTLPNQFTHEDRLQLADGHNPKDLKEALLQRLALVQALADTAPEKKEAVRDIKKFMRELDVLICQQTGEMVSFDVDTHVTLIETLCVDLGMNNSQLPGTQIVRVGEAGTINSGWAVGAGGLGTPKAFFRGATIEEAVRLAYDTLTEWNEERKAKKRGKKARVEA